MGDEGHGTDNRRMPDRLREEESTARRAAAAQPHDAEKRGAGAARRPPVLREGEGPVDDG